MSEPVVLSGWSKLSGKRRLAVLLFSAAVVISTGIHFFFAAYPDGAYDDPYMGCDCDWKFKDGWVFLEAEGSAKLIGSYTKTHGQWVVENLHGGNEQVIFQPSFFWDHTVRR
jgi:hypothetical protein